MRHFNLLLCALALFVCSCTQAGDSKEHLTIDDIINGTGGGNDGDDVKIDESVIQAAGLTDLMRTKAEAWRSASVGENCRNGVYVYSATFKKYASEPSKLAARIAVLGFKDVYLSTGDKSDISGASSALKKFISSCSSYGISVYVIRLSEASMLSDASVVDSDVSLVAGYNSKVARAERIAGISADIEPHIVRKSNPSGVLDAKGEEIFWNSDTGYGKNGPNDILLKYTLERLGAAGNALHDKSMHLAEAVLPNYQREFDAGRLAYGSTPQFLECCDFLIAMAYKTTKEKIWDYANLVVSASSVPQSVSVCIKTKLNDADSSTIVPRTWSYLLETASYIMEKGSAAVAFRGLDMFTYEGLEQMWEWTSDAN